MEERTLIRVGSHFINPNAVVLIEMVGQGSMTFHLTSGEKISIGKQEWEGVAKHFKILA